MTKILPRHRGRWVLVTIVVLSVLALARPVLHVMRTALALRYEEQYDPADLPPNVVDDASRMNRTEVRHVWHAPPDLETAERELSAILRQATRDGTKIAIAGARHTMGGHTQLPDAIVLDMTGLAHLDLDVERTRLRAGAGARWSQVIPLLDAHGLSVAVMQSNDDFTIGGSLSANCHGWQPRRPPIASTVRSMRVMTADGETRIASRTENPELFSLVLGGYGLFGIVTEAELDVVENARYRAERFEMPVDDYVEVWRREVAEREGVGMAFGRIAVAPEHFLDVATLNVFRSEPGESPALSPPSLPELRRGIFRGSRGSDFGKSFRFGMEEMFSEQLGVGAFSRNQLLFESASVYLDRSVETTDILHEYFVPPEEFVGFVRDLARVVGRHGADLLNVTVRDVTRDESGFLTYADRDLLALVLLFNQPRTRAADDRARDMTRELVNAVLGRGGRHYLPYRLHATREQVLRGYPRLDRFFELKRRWDPQELFQNRFYRAYGRPRGE